MQVRFDDRETFRSYSILQCISSVGNVPADVVIYAKYFIFAYGRF